MQRAGQEGPEKKHRGKAGHGLVLCLGLALASAPAHGTDLPAPLQEADFIAFDPAQARLGQLLFYDPILSGNRNIACATCHHPKFGTSDGLSLGIGEGGIGLGPDRTPGSGEQRIRRRIPRNAPALWNLGAREVNTLFHDGRVSVSDIYDNGFNTPAEEWLPRGLNSILAVQALFPLAAQFEMAGDPKENEVAGAAYDRIDRVWQIIAKRVRVIPEYAEMFIAAFDDVSSPLDITITHVANAIAAFEGTEFQSYDSPFDAFLAGDAAALDDRQRAGMDLFFGKAGCSACHSGKLLSDQRFHALMLPDFGPGRTRPHDPMQRDVGRMGASDRLEDAYRFRTPPLRNVALTAPYGHNGAYLSLEAMVRHHLDPRAGLAAWRPDFARLPDVPWLARADFLQFDDARERARLAARADIAPVALSDAEIADLVAFLNALTGTRSVKGRLGIPERVPSGLEVPRCAGFWALARRWSISSSTSSDCPTAPRNTA
ncbi:MAG: cytochrome C peroxidase, partial [Alphaproteobacteria bacterium]